MARWGQTAAVLVGALGFGAMGARANDSTAALTTGGLVLEKSADIEMRSELLSVSRERIEVRYRFFNRAAADRKVIVAFPLPEIDNRESGDVSVPDDDSDNFLKFRTRVDGREVAARIEQKAFVAGVEVTERLTALGVPLQPRAKRTLNALDALPKEVRLRLVKEGLVRPDDYDQGKGMEHHIAPEWSLRTTYHWEQTFPAGREIAIEHAYAPSVGASVQTGVGDRNSPGEAKEYRERFCTDKAFVAGVAALGKKNGGAPPPEFRLSYVLKTGANWAGPIGEFRLTVDKGAPGALVSFCETGVVKTGPTTFEVRKSDFTPTRDLDILIVDAPK